MSGAEGRTRRVAVLMTAAALLAACAGDAPPAADDPPASERPMPATPLGAETSGTAEPYDSLPASSPRSESAPLP